MKLNEEQQKCQFCNKTFTTKSGLYTHMRLHNGQLFCCTKCPKKYTSKANLKYHINSAHNEIV